MPTKFLPRKAEDLKFPNPPSSSSIEQHENKVKWLALHREEILEPDLPIIDPHHHLWERPTNRYLIEECLTDMRTGHNIRASVFVECGAFYRKTGPVPMASVGSVTRCS